MGVPVLSFGLEGLHLGAWPWHRICSERTCIIFTTAIFVGRSIPPSSCLQGVVLPLLLSPGLHLLCHPPAHLCSQQHLLGLPPNHLSVPLDFFPEQYCHPQL